MNPRARVYARTIDVEAEGGEAGRAGQEHGLSQGLQAAGVWVVRPFACVGCRCGPRARALGLPTAQAPCRRPVALPGHSGAGRTEEAVRGPGAAVGGGGALPPPLVPRRGDGRLLVRVRAAGRPGDERQ